MSLAAFAWPILLDTNCLGQGTGQRAWSKTEAQLRRRRINLASCCIFGIDGWVIVASTDTHGKDEPSNQDSGCRERDHVAIRRATFELSRHSQESQLVYPLALRRIFDAQRSGYVDKAAYGGEQPSDYNNSNRAPHCCANNWSEGGFPNSSSPLLFCPVAARLQHGADLKP